MYDCDIVYIKGNPKSGSLTLHKQIDACVMKLIETYSYEVIESDVNNNKNIEAIPIAKVYIGFSRGSRYLKKLDKNSLKISIGGISGSHIHQFVNKKDKILLGDIGLESMNAHFVIEETSQLKIKLLIRLFLEKGK